MRIAPKPQPGQEVSLAELLKIKPRIQLKAQNPEKNYATIISQTHVRWIFESISTLNGNVKLELFKDECPPCRFGETNQLVGCRLITADEFYGMMAAVYDTQRFPMDRTREWEAFSKWLTDRWESAEEPFLTNTILKFFDGRHGEVVHRLGTDLETRLPFDHSEYKIDTGNVREIFGAPNLATLRLVYGTKPIQINVPTSEIIDTDRSLYLLPGSITAHPTPAGQRGRALYVNTFPTRAP